MSEKVWDQNAFDRLGNGDGEVKEIMRGMNADGDACEHNAQTAMANALHGAHVVSYMGSPANSGVYRLTAFLDNGEVVQSVGRPDGGTAFINSGRKGQGNSRSLDWHAASDNSVPGKEEERHSLNERQRDMGCFAVIASPFLLAGALSVFAALQSLYS